jgi:hypothetical protein
VRKGGQRQVNFYYPDIGNKHEINFRSSIKNAALCKGGLVQNVAASTYSVVI